MFLLDCLKYFASLHSLKTLKWLFRAITALIESPATIKRLSVCVACQSFEDALSQSHIKTICDKLVTRQTHTRDERKLIEAMLANLTAILSLSCVEQYFVTADNDYNHMNNQLGSHMHQISQRYRG
jgi:hypothetical protein